MSNVYLSTEEILRVKEAAIEAGLADPQVRPLLLAGILPKYKGVLPMLPAPVCRCSRI